MPGELGEDSILFVIDDFKGKNSTEDDSIIILSARAYFLRGQREPRLGALVRYLLGVNADWWSLKKRRSFHDVRDFSCLVDLLRKVSLGLIVFEERVKNLRESVEPCWRGIPNPLKEITSESVEGMAFGVFLLSLVERAKACGYPKVDFLCDNFPFLEKRKNDFAQMLSQQERIEIRIRSLRATVTFKKQIRGNGLHLMALLGLADSETSTIGRILTREVEEYNRQGLASIRIALADKTFSRRLTPDEIEEEGIVCPNISPEQLASSLAALGSKYRFASSYWQFIEEEIATGRCLWNDWRTIARLLQHRQQTGSRLALSAR